MPFSEEFQEHPAPPAETTLNKKKQIYYHRAYRTFPSLRPIEYVGQFIVLTLPYVLLVLAFATPLSYYFCNIAGKILTVSSRFQPELIAKIYPLAGPLYLVDFLGKFPTVQFSLSTLILCIAGIFLVPRMTFIARSIGMYLILILSISLLSAGFFLCFPDKFPYSILSFCDLYMKTELGIWCLIPVIMAISLLFMPARTMEKFGVIGFMLLYSMLFGLVRFVVFLLVLGNFSYLFMATLLIAFDPPLDAFYLLGFYSIYVSRISERVNRHQEIWQW